MLERILQKLQLLNIQIKNRHLTTIKTLSIEVESSFYAKFAQAAFA
jgi:hypothetical protein